MPDPSRLASRFLAGPVLTAADIDTSADRLPVDPPSSVSPADFFTANGGGGMFIAGAVSFDGDAALSITSLTASDTTTILWSLWFWVSPNPADPAESDYTPLWCSDPDTYNYFAILEAGDEGHPNTYTEFGNPDESTKLRLRTTGTYNLGTAGTWRNYLFYADATGLPIGNVYLNDEAVDPSANVTQGAGGASNFDGMSFYVGSDSFIGYTGYLSEVWIGVGQFLDLTVEANRRKFISATGKPVDLGADGSTPTGTQPTVYFHAEVGDEAATFAVNRGTGGTFTLTGALTAAPSNPSE